MHLFGRWGKKRRPRRGKRGGASAEPSRAAEKKKRDRGGSVFIH